MPPKSHNRGRGGVSQPRAGPTVLRRSRKDAPKSKRHRCDSSDSEHESPTDVEADVIAESILPYLIKHDGLLDNFIQNLFTISKLLENIVAHVRKLCKTASTDNAVTQTLNAVSHDLNSTTETLF